MGDLSAIVLALALLAGNAFFVGAEFALVSARRTQVEPRAEAGSRAARSALRAMEHVSLMMAGAQLGITVCSLGLGAVGEPAVAHLLEPLFGSLGLSERLLHPVSFVVAMTVVVSLHMVLGEMVPKNVALAGPERAALLLGPPLYAVVKVLHPLIWLLNQLANAVLRLLRVEPQEEVTSTFTREEVADLIGESRREGLLEDRQHELLAGAMQMEERRVSEVLLRMDRMVSVELDTRVDEVERLCAETGYSRFPVLDDGSLVGYLHVKDLLSTDSEERTRPFAERFVRPLPVVEADQTLREAVRTMQRQGAHLARVDGEAAGEGAGEVVGLITLEDALEELVGHVTDAAQRPAQKA